MALSNQLIMNEGRAQYPYAVTAVGEAHRIIRQAPPNQSAPCPTTRKWLSTEVAKNSVI